MAKTIKTASYNPFNHLQTEDEIKRFFEDAMNDENPQVFINALSHWVRHHGVSEVCDLKHDMIKLIKTPEDHAEALARVADLMDSKNSEDGHELNALSLLIADYEKRNQLFSIDKPITALDIIKLRMEQNGLSYRNN